MVQSLVTKKIRVSLYLDENLKSFLESLAVSRRRSLSNLIEVLCEQEVDAALKSGEITPTGGDESQS